MILYYFAFASLIISVLCQTPPGQPEITAPQTIILGNSYSLSCSSTGGSPPTTVSFLKDNTVISTTTNSLNSATTTDTYTFTAARADHFEVFECQVDNNVLQNPLSTTVFVTVNFAPQLPTISGPNTLTQGDQGTWICLSTNGYPTPTMTARIGNTQFTTGFTTTSVLTNQAYTVNGTLIWSPTTANNGQSLCCVVSHSVLSTPQTACLTLTVNSPLAINAPVLQYNPTIGTNVVLRCEITAGTATNVKWFKDNSELNIGGNSRLSVGTNTVPSLTITGVVQSDQGGYVCQATDGTATVNTATINVNPQGTPPVVTLPQTVYSQITGNSVTLQCTVSSPNSPLQEVQWRFTNQAGVTIDPIIIPTGTNPKYQGSSTTSPALMINNVQSTDQGSYQCRARNLIGTTLSTQSAALTVTGSLPVVQVPTPTYSVVYGSQVTLACNIVSASPAVSNVYWTKISNGVTSTINNGAAGTQGITPSSPSLTINFATTSDEGTYRCYATNAVGTGQSVTTTQLTVTGGTLTIGISPATDTVIQGTTKVITCSVSGQPSATSISWTKGGFPLTISSSGGKYSGGTPSVPHLTINNFQSSDAATYTCSATNVAGTVTSGNSVLSFLGLLTVTVSPSTNTVTLGDASVTIQCSVSGSTQATSWEWTKNPIAGGNTEIISQGTNNGDRQVVNSATNPNLILTGITESDEGVYRCRANNGAGLVTSKPSTLVVQGGIPSVNVEPSQYTGTIGDASYQIQCTVTAVPEATSWYWTFTPIGGSVVNIPQGTNNANYMMDNSPTKPHLTIKTLASSDAGDYKCFAVNQAGQSSSSNSRLNVVGDKPTVNISPATANVVNGNTQFISCTVTATPAVQSVTWYKNGAVLNPSSNTAKYSGGTAQVPSLTISNFQSTDSGTYYCTATNAAGTGTSLPDTSVLTYVEYLSLSATPNSGSADIGESQYIINCQISGTPQASSYYWTKNPTDGSASSRINQGTNTVKYTVAASATNPSLTIKNIVQSDDANYVCTATNVAGTRSSNSARLLVTGAIPQISATPILQSPTYGASFIIIQCSVSGTPAAQSVGWRKVSLDGQTIVNIDAPNSNGKYSIANSLVAPHLTINNLDFDDDANYQCTATNAVDTGVSNSARVDVVGNRPVASIPQTAYTVVYGNDVTIPCQITGANPSHTIVTWYYAASSNLQFSTINVGDLAQYNGGTFSVPPLTIKAANNNDAGFYRCGATNVVGEGLSSNTQLSVIGELPVVQLSKTTEDVIYGESITITCTRVSQIPSVTNIFWQITRSGQTTSIDVVNSGGKYSGSSLSNPSLTINNVNFTDEALYRCLAENLVGFGQSSDLTLSITGGLLTVSIPSSTYSVLLGNQISITCSVSGTPSATRVYWQKQQPSGVYTDVDITGNNRYSGGSISNPTLVITNAEFGDEGNYRCHATNAAGTAQSIVTNLDVTGSIPVVSIQSTSYSINIGNTITLECSVTANPQATQVKWQKIDSNNNPTDVNMSNPRYTGSTVSNPSLTISNAVKADEDRYICLASNIVGTGTSPQSTYLTVVGSIPSVTVPQPSYSVNKGSSVTLQCSYTSNPSATFVRWEKTVGNVVTQIGDTSTTNKYSGSTLSSPSLVINNAVETDEGNYVCKVTNSLGTGISSSTNLDVVGNIPQVTVPTDAYTVNIDSSVTLQCTVTADPTHTAVYWQKVSGGTTTNIVIDSNKYTGASVSNPSLTINNVSFTDAGTYYCYATNAIGTGASTQVVVGVSGNVPTVSLTTNIFTVDYGNDVILGCTVSANPTHTSVYWQKIVPGGNPITINLSNTNKYGGSSPTNPSLTIKNTDTNDQGKYVCFAANSVGTGQSSEGRLDVIGTKPVVTIPQSSYTINIGNSITIGCTIDSNPAHTNVYWTKKIGTNPEQTITTGGSPTKYGGSTLQSPALIIYNVEESDAAQYNCYATNLVGTGSSSTPTTLNVIGNVPEVSASVVSSVRLGESVTIECDVTANPDATDIKWQFVTSSSISNIDIANNNRYTGGSPTVPNLTINPVQESDEGNYRCQATNNVGTGTSNQVFLDTTGDPPQSVAITPSPITVTEGNTITATCTATGNPNPTFEWTKSGSNTVIKTGSVLQILNAQESHRGDYICKASNSFGSNTAQVNVDVQFIPKVTITDQAVEGKRGASAIIPCEFNSNPFATKVEWTKFASGTTVILNVDGSKYQGATLSNPSLTIYDLDSNDAASYRCEVTNSVGTGKSEYGTLTVDLTFAPQGINIYPGQITVLEGNSFSIYCNATANPAPSYEWYHDDNMLQAGQTLTISVSDYNQHDGLYTCKAFNSAGLQQATIDVDVKYPPISAVTQNSFNPTLGNGVTLTCDTLANPSAISWQWKYNTFNLEGADDKTYFVDMDSTTDAGQYSCIAYNEVGQSSEIVFTVNLATVTTAVIGSTPAIGEVASAGLTGGEIAAIALGILFFILLLIVLLVCCVLQGCCAFCFGAGAGREKEKVTPDTARIVDVPRFYEVGGVGGVPTVVTSEPGYYTEYGDERYVTSSARPYYLPAIEYTYDDEERRRRHRKKKRSRRHDELQREEQIVLEERVVGGGDVYHTTRKEEEVVAGPEFYFEAE